jgi:hypothetical protein
MLLHTLALPSNVRLGRESSPGRNPPSVSKIKSFITSRQKNSALRSAGGASPAANASQESPRKNEVRTLSLTLSLTPLSPSILSISNGLFSLTFSVYYRISLSHRFFSFFLSLSFFLFLSLSLSLSLFSLSLFSLSLFSLSLSVLSLAISLSLSLSRYLSLQWSSLSYCIYLSHYISPSVCFSLFSHYLYF